MLLRVCDENFLFFISHTKYVDIFCYFVIFLCLVLTYVIQKKTTKDVNNIYAGIKKYLVFLASFVFLIFVVFIFFTIINGKKYEGCQCGVPEYLQLQNRKYEVSEDIKLKDITKNKVIIVGDSRMQLIEKSKDEINIPVNFSFIAQIGAGKDWFNKEALPKLLKELDSKNNEYKYHVVINMGVNDIQYSKNVDKEINYYLEEYNKLSRQYPDVLFYLLSINPINDKKLNISQPYNVRTTEMVEYFNRRLDYNIKANKSKNITYCDSYHEIYFRTVDGIHYTNKTNQNVIDYISNDCLEY